MSYAYDANFVMDLPQCERHHMYEVTSKSANRVSFVTAYIEIREVGWPDGAADDAAQRTLCTARSGTVSTRGTQAWWTRKYTASRGRPHRLGVAE